MKKVSYLLIFLAAFQFISGYSASNGNLNQNERDKSIRTTPFTLLWDDMPIDIFFQYEDEKTAGKNGFLTVVGDRFVFEDGTEARFCGTNFNSSQNFPSHENSEVVARRLAKIGVNTVRFHQMDTEWSIPNLFQFTMGDNLPNTMVLDSTSLDRLDYLVYCLKQEGINVYVDLLTYRRFKTGDGVEMTPVLGNGAKSYVLFDRENATIREFFLQRLNKIITRKCSSI